MARTPVLPAVSTRASAVILGAMITGSALWRGLSARAIESPWIMPDELIYSSLARSVADGGWFAIRGVHTTAYSIVYPLLLSGPFGLTSPSAAYAAAKWENAIVMSLAAIPVFLLARRLLPNLFALVASGLSLLIPSFAYTGVLMTENAFFPLFLLALLAIVRALERPTTGRQLAALAVVFLAFLTRAEGIVLLAVFLFAIGLLSLGEARRLAELRRYATTALVILAAVVAAVLAEALRGNSPAAILGTYSSTIRGYPLGGIPRWILAQLADLELYLIFLPFLPAFIAVWALLTRPAVARGKRASASVGAAALVCTVLLVAVFSAGPGEQASNASTYPTLPRSLHERYLFYLVPLFIIFWLYWLLHRSEFTNRGVLVLLVPVILLPLALPYAHVLTNVDFEAFSLLPWNNDLIARRHVPAALVVIATILLPLMLVRRNSVLLLQVGLVAAFFWLVGLVAVNETHQASLQIPTSHPDHPSWVDAAVPAHAHVAVVWRADPSWSQATTLGREHALWRAEFFNWSVDRYFYIGTPMHYGLPEAPIRLPRTLGGKARYVLTASPLPLHGRIIAADRKAGLRLYELVSPA